MPENDNINLPENFDELPPEIQQQILAAAGDVNVEVPDIDIAGADLTGTAYMGDEAWQALATAAAQNFYDVDNYQNVADSFIEQTPIDLDTAYQLAADSGLDPAVIDALVNEDGEITYGDLIYGPMATDPDAASKVAGNTEFLNSMLLTEAQNWEDAVKETFGVEITGVGAHTLTGGLAEQIPGITMEEFIGEDGETYVRVTMEMNENIEGEREQDGAPHNYDPDDQVRTVYDPETGELLNQDFFVALNVQGYTLQTISAGGELFNNMQELERIAVVAEEVAGGTDSVTDIHAATNANGEYYGTHDVSEAGVGGLSPTQLLITAMTLPEWANEDHTDTPDWECPVVELIFKPEELETAIQEMGYSVEEFSMEFTKTQDFSFSTSHTSTHTVTSISEDRDQYTTLNSNMEYIASLSNGEYPEVNPGDRTLDTLLPANEYGQDVLDTYQVWTGTYFDVATENEMISEMTTETTIATTTTTTVEGDVTHTVEVDGQIVQDSEGNAVSGAITEISDGGTDVNVTDVSTSTSSHVVGSTTYKSGEEHVQGETVMNYTEHTWVQDGRTLRFNPNQVLNNIDLSTLDFRGMISTSLYGADFERNMMVGELALLAREGRELQEAEYLELKDSLQASLEAYFSGVGDDFATLTDDPLYKINEALQNSTDMSDFQTQLEAIKAEVGEQAFNSSLSLITQINPELDAMLVMYGRNQLNTESLAGPDGNGPMDWNNFLSEVFGVEDPALAEQAAIDYFQGRQLFAVIGESFGRNEDIGVSQNIYGALLNHQEELLNGSLSQDQIAAILIEEAGIWNNGSESAYEAVGAGPKAIIDFVLDPENRAALELAVPTEELTQTPMSLWAQQLEADPTLAIGPAWSGHPVDLFFSQHDGVIPPEQQAGMAALLKDALAGYDPNTQDIEEVLSNALTLDNLNNYAHYTTEVWTPGIDLMNGVVGFLSNHLVDENGELYPGTIGALEMHANPTAQSELNTSTMPTYEGGTEQEGGPDQSTVPNVGGVGGGVMAP